MKYIGQSRPLPLHPHELDVPVITHIPIGPAVLPHYVPVTEGLPSSLAGHPCTVQRIRDSEQAALSSPLLLRADTSEICLPLLCSPAQRDTRRGKACHFILRMNLSISLQENISKGLSMTDFQPYLILKSSKLN